MLGAGVAKGATSEVSLVLYIWWQQFVWEKCTALYPESPVAERRFNCGAKSICFCLTVGWVGDRAQTGKRGIHQRALGGKEKTQDSGPHTLMLQSWPWVKAARREWDSSTSARRYRRPSVISPLQPTEGFSALAGATCEKTISGLVQSTKSLPHSRVLI